MSTQDMPQGFTITRRLAASPEQVWHAWTDPDAIAAWWHPRDTSTPRDEVHVDLRVGGSYRYTMVNDHSGERVVSGGVYLELDPHRRLVFSWGEPEDEPNESPVVTVTLEPTDDGTDMTFELRGVPGARGDAFF